METVRIDLSACRDKAALMQAFANGLQLPRHFGHNWDALWDCLQERPACRIEVWGWSVLRRQAPTLAAALDALRADLADAGRPILIEMDGAPH